MLDSLVALQTGDSTQTLLVSRGYAISFLMLFSMVYLRYRTRQRFKQWVYLTFGTVIVAFFLFSTGTIWFHWPAPGVIWSLALTLVVFMTALAFAWVAFGPEDVFVAHHREHQHYADDENDRQR